VENLSGMDSKDMAQTRSMAHVLQKILQFPLPSWLCQDMQERPITAAAAITLKFIDKIHPQACKLYLFLQGQQQTISGLEVFMFLVIFLLLRAKMTFLLWREWWQSFGLCTSRCFFPLYQQCEMEKQFMMYTR
jgi:hypothetical protein